MSGYRLPCSPHASSSIRGGGPMVATTRPRLVTYVIRPRMASLITSARYARTSRVVR